MKKYKIDVSNNNYARYSVYKRRFFLFWKELFFNSNVIKDLEKDIELLKQLPKYY